MKLFHIQKIIEDLVDRFLCWIDQVFNIPPSGGKAQLLPLRRDGRRSVQNYDDYPLNLLKMLLIFLATLLLMLTAGKMAFE